MPVCVSGTKRAGTVEILWPGGVRNKLYNVRAGERIAFPEIPCSYDSSLRFGSYVRCVTKALGSLVAADQLTRAQARRFLSSAVTAYRNEH